MLSAPIPKNESDRIKSLKSLNILDTIPEERFDRIIRTAQKLLNVPVVLLSLVDSNRQWFKSSVGLDAKETPRDISFCGHAINQDNLFIVPNALVDSRFSDNPLVKENPNIRFYAGRPLNGPGNHKIGTLCAIDYKAKNLTDAEKQVLEDLSAWVELEINASSLSVALETSRNTQETLNRVYEMSLDMICIAGFDGYFKKINPAFCRTLGYPSSELLSKTFFEFIHPHDIEITKKELARLGLGERSLFFENRFMCQDGSIKWLSWTASPSVKDNLVYAIARDITPLKQLQHQLKENEERLDLAIKGSGIGIWDWDIETNSVYYSEHFKKLLGYGMNEFFNTFEYFEEHLHPDDCNKVICSLREHIETNEIFDMDFRLRLKNGNYRWFRAISQSTLGTDKKNLRMSGTIQDIHEKKLTEENLHKVNLELDSFVYTASHDLRAPLRAISSFSKFLLEDYKEKFDAEGLDYVNEIIVGTKRMEQLIDDLLMLSRISRIVNPMEVADINSVIVEVCLRLSYDIKENNVTLLYPKDFPHIYCDKIKLTEVFANLVGNAIKFSSKTGKVPIVEIGYTELSNGYEFFVKDNGIGIDPQYHDQVFGIFKRLNKQTEYEGTGAGLSIVKRIIDDHSGKILIESALGAGSKFVFTIPKLLPQ